MRIPQARIYNPRLMRFSQPDTIIPDGNPQSLNRYSYVKNSPIMYTDPTGNIPQQNCVDDGFKCFNKGGGNTGVHLPANQDEQNNDFCDNFPNHTACGGAGTEREKKETTETIITTVITTTPTYIVVPTVSSHSGWSAWPEELYWFWEDVAVPIWTAGRWLEDYQDLIRPAYRNTRYFFNLGIIEGIVAGGKQMYMDSWSQNLTPGQRIIRAGVVGFETYLTDKVADAAGAILGAKGGFLGDKSVNYLATEAMESFWRKLNYKTWNQVGLGVPTYMDP